MRHSLVCVILGTLLEALVGNLVGDHCSVLGTWFMDDVVYMFWNTIRITSCSWYILVMVMSCCEWFRLMHI